MDASQCFIIYQNIDCWLIEWSHVDFFNFWLFVHMTGNVSVMNSANHLSNQGTLLAIKRQCIDNLSTNTGKKVALYLPSFTSKTFSWGVDIFVMRDDSLFLYGSPPEYCRYGVKPKQSINVLRHNIYQHDFMEFIISLFVHLQSIAASKWYTIVDLEK